MCSKKEFDVCCVSGERPFKCTMCSKTFNQKGALQVHMTKHTGERSHMCQFCPATFAQKGNLRAHIHVRRFGIIQERIGNTFIALITDQF